MKTVIEEILPLQIPGEILYVSVIDFHLILTMLLHYLVKSENLK